MSVNTERWTAEAAKVAEYALREALSLGHNYIGTEHLLLGLTRVKDCAGAEVLWTLGVEHRHAKDAVVEHLVARRQQEELNRSEVDRYREALREIASTPASGSDVFRTQRMARFALGQTGETE
jgi:ATP-dependent Clp protease ATP-binding subunit ClpA